jgi:Uma2 family endonuclease
MLLERSRKWTRDEYQKLQGILPQDSRVELLGGVLVEMSPQNPPHSFCVAQLSRILMRQLSETYSVRVQLPLDLSNDSQPEPDFAVVKNEAVYFEEHPKTAILVIEVADSSLDYDRIIKRSYYQDAAVEEYIVVDVAGRKLEVFREGKSNVFGFEECFHSNSLPLKIKVREIFELV